MFRYRFILCLTALLGWVPISFGAAPACGAKGLPCKVSGVDAGTYYLVAPDSSDQRKVRKVFVFFHGHNGSGAGILKNKQLISSLQQAGYILAAPDGPQFTFRGRTSRRWAARQEEGAPRGGRDDIRFIENMLHDIASRYPIDINQTVVSGFSSGGSMAWHFSCYSKMKLGGVVAVAGGLRRPLPGERIQPNGQTSTQRCPGGPRKLVHIHGFGDRQVPLEGRRIRDWHQGDVFEGLAVQRLTNQCGSRPDKAKAVGNFWCREWTRCTSKRPLRLCLHSGGHGMPKNWLSESLGWMSK